MDANLTDLWYFSRPKLAKEYLAQITSGISNRVALFGFRRTGKTSLILREMVPLAEKAGLFTVYSDCWLDKTDPLGSLNYALQQAIDRVEIPKTTTGKRLKTEVKKLGIGGFSIEFGQEPRGNPPDSPYFKFDWLLQRLVARVRKSILFVIDEFQTIATHKEGERIAGALRTAFTKQDRTVRVLFTGSSETQLMSLFAQTRATLYRFAASTRFQMLDADFVEHIAEKFYAATKRKLDTKRAIEIFRMLGHQPEAFLFVVQVPLARSDYSLDDGLAALLALDARTTWAQHWNDATLLQRAVLVACNEKLQLTSDTGIKRIAEILGKKSVNPASIRRAIEALYNRGFIERATLGNKTIYEITDAVLALWIKHHSQLRVVNSL